MGHADPLPPVAVERVELLQMGAPDAGLVLERATGTSVSDYMATKLWQPLGAEADATWSLAGSVMPVDLVPVRRALISVSDKAGLADHYAGIVGLTGFEKSYPHELSGGMLKRAELARAIIKVLAARQ